MSQVIPTIEFGGRNPNWAFNGLSIRQVYNDHHQFELSYLIQHPDKKQGETALRREELTQLLGEQVTIRIAPDSRGAKVSASSDVQAAKAPCLFTGFIDQVIPTWGARVCALRIVGYSYTMMMDCGPCFRTFYKKSLSQIAQKIIGAYGGKAPSLLPRNAGVQTGFSVQYQETDYRFLCRLADTYGALLYFDGQKLHLGDFENGGDSLLPLPFGENLKQANLSLNIAPLNFKMTGFDVEKSEVLSWTTSGTGNNSGKLASETIRRSGAYPAPDMHFPTATDGLEDLQARSVQLLSKQAYELVRLSGVSNVPGLKIGSAVSIVNTKEALADGAYTVIEINHSVSNDNSYSNTFTAVPRGYPVALRMQNARSPLCGPLMAVVKEHDDPKKLSRVRVEFIGDSEKTLSPWLRVLTPYTGFGGMFFAPEPGDHVVVQAEDFNIEKFPFVTGAFYHGKADAKQWHDPRNKKKGFTTEKVKFLIDDRSGKLSIEADEIELIARQKIRTEGEQAEHNGKQKMKINGGRHLSMGADRIDLN